MEELGIPQKRLLINVGDETITSNEDIKEFNRLDEEDSGKQVILLVNKGKEGWNCRSLFSVALFREPKSKIFVLQATMRCMRSIGLLQETATVYMTEDCKSILVKELDANFRMTIEELQGAGGEKKTYKVKPVPPPIRITVAREAAMYRLSDRSPAFPVKFGFEGYDLSRYTSVHRVSRITDIRNVAREGVIEVQAENRRFSEMTLVAEIARYLNRPCLEIESILHGSDAGFEATLGAREPNTMNFFTTLSFPRSSIPSAILRSLRLGMKRIWNSSRNRPRDTTRYKRTRCWSRQRTALSIAVTKTAVSTSITTVSTPAPKKTTSTRRYATQASPRFGSPGCSSTGKANSSFRISIRSRTPSGLTILISL